MQQGGGERRLPRTTRRFPRDWLALLRSLIDAHVGEPLDRTRYWAQPRSTPSRCSAFFCAGHVFISFPWLYDGFMMGLRWWDGLAAV